MNDLIRRQDVNDALQGLHVGDVRFFEKLRKALDAIPTAEPDNQVHLCDSCHYGYPECSAMKNEVIFGNGKGHDNICACAKYIPSAETERKKGEWWSEGVGYADGEPVYDMWSCSVCGKYFDEWEDEPDWKFCPNCGAEMSRGE